jgi:hypothetical protein
VLVFWAQILKQFGIPDAAKKREVNEMMKKQILTLCMVLAFSVACTKQEEAAAPAAAPVAVAAVEQEAVQAEEEAVEQTEQSEQVAEEEETSAEKAPEQK